MTIPNSVTILGAYAFNNCSRLTSLTIGESVAGIGNYAFYGCTGLTSVEIPGSVTRIGDYGFYGCTGLTSVSIPNSVLTIGNNAFDGCNGLTSVTIPNSVTSIGDYAFNGCTGMLDVAISNSAETIGTSAFQGCTALTRIDIPNSVTGIGASAFQGCTGLTKVVLGNSVATIGNYAFGECGGLSIITIPQSVTSIGSNAFQNCTSLKALNFNAVNCADFAYNIFTNCPLETIIVGDDVTRIPAYMTSSAQKAVLTTLIIGNSVATIGNYAFYNCTGLTDLTLPNSIATIGANSFTGCTNLKTLYISGEGEWMAGTLPMNTSIETLYIGSGITLLSDMQVNPTDVYCFTAEPPTCHSNTFSGYTGTLHVPAASFVDYCFATTWENFNNVQADAVEPKTINLSQTLLEMSPDDVASLTAQVMPLDAYPNTVLWYSSDPDVATVKDGVVTAVGLGECDVIAYCYPVRKVCHVVVSEASIDVIITLDQHKVWLQPNSMITLTPTVTPIDVELSVTSSDPTVANARLVNGLIRVVAIKAGTTVVTVGSVDGTAQPDSCTVIVYNDPGDVNGDGRLSIGDVTALINMLLSDDTEDNPAADVNGDGKISIADVTALINILLSGD